MILPKEQLLKKMPIHVHIRSVYETKEVWVNGLHLKSEDYQLIRSPHGFNWGYGGIGPAQFAFALLRMWVEQDTALHYHTDLKFGYIAGLPQRSIDVHINLRWVMDTILVQGPFLAVKSMPVY